MRSLWRVRPAGLGRWFAGLEAQPDFTLPRSQVSVTVTRPCVLSPVGYDATPEIRRGAHQQAARAQAMIDGVLAQVRPAALQAIEQVPREAPLGVQRKAVVQLAEVVQGHREWMRTRLYSRWGCAVRSRYCLPEPNRSKRRPCLRHVMIPN